MRCYLHKGNGPTLGSTGPLAIGGNVIAPKIPDNFPLPQSSLTSLVGVRGSPPAPAMVTQ